MAGQERAAEVDLNELVTQLDLDPELVEELQADPDLVSRMLAMKYFGQQVLRKVAEPVAEITGDLVDLADRMLLTMDIHEGVGLAAPQVGRKIRLFVHALEDEAPTVLFNPEVVETDESWVYKEGCLSIPGLHFDVVRPKLVHVRAIDIDGEEVNIEGDELLGRVCLHEIDHLDGVLFVDRLNGEDREAATLDLTERVHGTLGVSDPFLTGKPIRKLAREAKL